MNSVFALPCGRYVMQENGFAVLRRCRAIPNGIALV